MIQGRTILCFASGYDAPPTSKHHVMHLLAEHNTVLWVNYHASRAPTASSSDLLYMARKLWQIACGLVHPRKNLYVLTPLVVPLPASRAARRINRMLLIGQLRMALASIRRGPLQIWSFTPDVSYALGRFGEERAVYYCVDDFAGFSGYDRRQVLADEADLCRRADLVVTTSLALRQAKSPLNPNTILVPHGVDYEHFRHALQADLAEPSDLVGIPHPRLGFFGLIRDWVDLDLLAKVARRRGDWHFVLIGDSTVDLGAYRGLPNMHFLGRKPYAQLPAYCKGFDVGLIPFVVNKLTQSVNPIKLREYLAAGLPVVSSPMPEVLACPQKIDIAATVDEFVAKVDAILAHTPRQVDQSDRVRRLRSQSVADETWDAKVRRIIKALENLGGSLPPSHYAIKEE